MNVGQLDSKVSDVPRTLLYRLWKGTFLLLTPVMTKQAFFVFFFLLAIVLECVGSGLYEGHVGIIFCRLQSLRSTQEPLRV